MDNTGKFLVIGGGLAAAAFWFVTKDKNGMGFGGGIPVPPPPTSASGGPNGNGISNSNNTNQSPVLMMNDPQVVNAIRQRIEQLYSNKNTREQIYDANDVRGGIYAGVVYANGMKFLLRTALPDGNPNRVPVIPASMSTEYSDRLELVQQLRGMEEMDSMQSWSEVKQIWQQGADMGTDAGFSFWTPNIADIMGDGYFYVSGGGDRNQSERYDSWSTDVKTMAANIQEANRKAENALKLAAIGILRGAGWRLEGYDFD